ncbi:MAG: D-alanyl-D-alanine carboxypeptidase/D-alanyl-D-alanine-endopeptidase [Gemmatimonadota bacterium]|nr:D-alanyl-D-alanine carboxypeptidase/D-alanyl-D-alanine-endopeptidase [Gemmatimonadota bacterium]
MPRSLPAGLAVLAAVVAFAAPARGQSLPAPLEQALNAWYQETAARTAPGMWGIAIGTMDGRVLWSAAPEATLIPASTAKVFTTGFARTRVGSDARAITRVVARGRVDPATGTWLGDWRLDLGGDPTLERAGRAGPMLRDLADQLAAQGVRRLTGPLVVSSPHGTTAARYPATWSERYTGKLYAPPVGPITLHENIISVMVRPGVPGQPAALSYVLPAGIESLIDNQAVTVPGSRTRLSFRPTADGRWTLAGTIGARSRGAGFSDVAHDPGAVLGAVWQSALAQAGIAWDRRAPATTAPPHSRAAGVLALVASPPFDSIASEVNRRSLNIGAELMLEWGAGSRTRGPALLTDHVRRVVGPFARVELVDGSGLSELNRVSPLTMMLYLARLPQVPEGRNFPMLLPANGTGTLRHLRGSLGSGVVHAKTGTLDNVATLAGYLGRPDGVLVVSLMYNGPRTGAARRAQWELFRLLGADGVSVPTALVTQMGGSEGR